MADNTEEIRCKVPREHHAVLTGFAQARGMELQEVMRQIIANFVNAKVNESKIILSNIQNGEGIKANGAERRAKGSRDVLFDVGETD